MDNHARFQAVCVEVDNGFVGGSFCFAARLATKHKKAGAAVPPRPEFGLSQLD
jgi:hypothetical protein